MNVAMWMTKKVITIAPEASIVVAAQLMFEHQIRRLVVIDADGKLEGIVSKHDVLHAFPAHINPFTFSGSEAEKGSGSEAEKGFVDIKSILSFPVKTTTANTPIEEAAAVLYRFKIGALPVMDKNKLVGLITESDIFRAFNHLLSTGQPAVRVTFDEPDEAGVRRYIERCVDRYDLQLDAFINFQWRDKRRILIRLRGEQIDAFVEDVWQSGLTVQDITHCGQEPILK